MIHDQLFWLTKINQASLIAGMKDKRFSKELAQVIAKGIKDVEAQVTNKKIPTPKKYIQWEPAFLQSAGLEASILHAGRSSQDILSTMRTAMFREGCLSVLHHFDQALSALISFSETHKDVIVPSYTNGVGAQPTYLGHTLIGFTSSLLRTRKQLQLLVEDFNECSMGAAVLNGTGWPLNRERTASLLGFNAPVDNAFDATCLHPVDFPLSTAGILASAACRIATLMNDLMVQYSQIEPWLLLREGGMRTYISSAMPQKRNPGLINQCRESCSDVLGECQTVMLRAHNVASGMIDGKEIEKNYRLLDQSVSMFEKLTLVLESLVVNKKRALQEVNSDWTVSQEIADELMLNHNVPFRVGHAFASRVVTHAKQKHMTPLNFPYEDFKAIYSQLQSEHPEILPKTIPFSEEEFKKAVNPKNILNKRITKGSSSLNEIERMISEEKHESSHLSERRINLEKRIDQALSSLNQDFDKLTK